jgi:hypothetical protein
MTLSQVFRLLKYTQKYITWHIEGIKVNSLKIDI